MGKKRRIKQEKKAREQADMERVMHTLYEQYCARVKAKKLKPPNFKPFCDMFVMGYEASRAETVQEKINEAVQAILETNLAVDRYGSPEAFMKDKIEAFDERMVEKAKQKAEADAIKQREETFAEDIYAEPESEHGPKARFAEENPGIDAGIDPF